ncbi:hypothetical protein N7499_001571 [Penicillium canescens]|uniref:uncharacterized protein n=1 Tax=Penicillium canescens TaxID=5083 RepID=UPI0026E0B48D|nr:uncharacterized protein N7446_009114 [Penicillium canescens]KAJ6046026.1 hypothetical protein N7444_007280 [Penicillium canescens]KAJ6053102.1 hypothetical protein N7446_009114 [Penicillium canescens]KAJ6097197.1 hypothetical protein N7499_001571 [Penicillium canescens]KAJ6165187.1 hypothetical protein N7485_008431 [Penicillium canescens]
MESDTLSARRERSRLSSSAFPRQGWPRVSPSHAPPVVNASDPSHLAYPRNYESAAEESDRAYRTTALRQLTGNPRPLSRTSWADNPGSERRSSTLPTRPVLVRAYSGDAGDNSSQSSAMSARRFFPFTGSRGAASAQPQPQPDLILPSDKDFSIESILQAIEPDIRGTLESIAEICGRSKLSLANEYGSHIAPLGEICAPPGGLGPVEEASLSEEQRSADNVVVQDEDINIADTGRDMQPFSFHRYLENSRHTASMLEQNGASHPAGTGQPDPLISPAMNPQPGSSMDIGLDTLPLRREFASRPKNGGRDLLAKSAVPSNMVQQVPNIATPALVSEVHLDARADGRSSNEPHLPPKASLDDAPIMRTPGPELIQSLLGWLKWPAGIAGPDSRPALQSAEGRLRAMLDHAGNQDAVPAML